MPWISEEINKQDEEVSGVDIDSLMVDETCRRQNVDVCAVLGQLVAQLLDIDTLLDLALLLKCLSKT